MKKRTKIIIGVVVSILVLSIAGLGFAGNYLYDLAIDPTTDKSMVFDNKSTSNDGDVNKENDFFERVEYKDRYIKNDGYKLHAYDFNQNSDVYVVVVHGYVSEGTLMGVSSEHFYNMGYNVLTVDLRAHGLSEGGYIGMGWDDRLDVISWVDDLIKENKDTKIILYGVSMGAATVMNATGEKLPSNVKLAIEDCGYTSTRDIFAYQLDSLFGLPEHPFLDAASLVTNLRAGYSFDDGPIDQVKKSKTPTLFIHGDKDLFVPFRMLDEVYKASSAPKDQLVIEDAGHAQSYLVNPEKYWSKVDAFIKKYL